MNNNLSFIPKLIKEYINDLKYKLDDIGTSEDSVILFENKYVLKISSNIELLKKEYELCSFVYGKIPSPEPKAFIIENNKAYFLRGFIEGESLILDRIPSDHKELIKILKEAVDILKEMDKYDCPYPAPESIGNEFIHGDLCLPNILIDKDNKVVGFVDLCGAGRGDRWFDYAWLIWSMQYNLKTNEYRDELLEALGVTFDEEKYNLYIPEDYRQ